MAYSGVVTIEWSKQKLIRKSLNKNDRRSGLLLWLLALALIFGGCGGGSNSAPISVSVSPTSATVQAGGTQQFVALVTNDTTNQGVNWEVTCSNPPCGSVAPTTTASGDSSTYTAPGTPPTANLNVAVKAKSVANPNSIANVAIMVPSITVSVAPSNMTVEAGATQQFTATVTGDTSNSGVGWSLAQSGTPCSPGCGTIAPSTTASGAPATYTAPAAAPSSDMTVAVIATSVAISAVSTSSTITVSAVTVSVTPTSALLPVGITQPFMATVGYDPKNQGAAWTLTQGGTSCSPTCGSISAATTASGSPTNYTAPGTVPATPSVTLTATSVSDGTKTSAVTITLSTGTVQIVPDSLDFGQVLLAATSSPMVATLTNRSTTALSITGITITGASSGDFSETNTCPSSLVVGASCDITVTFKPTKGNGSTASISIADSSPDSPQQVNLKGLGKALTAVALAAVRSALAQTAMAVVPYPTGTETVGTRTIQLRDATRRDPFATNGGNRVLLVRFWYPASLTEPCRQAEYTPPRVWEYFSEVLGAHLPEVITHSCVDAPVKEGAHPIVVFTHGYTGTFTDYTYLFEELASRGYVVASVNHTGEATAVEFPNAVMVPSKLGSYLKNSATGDDKTLAFAVSVRLQDLRYVVSEVERLNTKQDDPFAGKLDVARIAVAGHSLGGTTAFLALEQDARLRAAIILDGNLPAALVRPTQMPVLLVTAGSANWNADTCRVWNRLRGPRMAVNLNGAEHVALSDLVWLANGAIETGSMGLDSTVETIRKQVTAFLDTHLRERPVARSVTGLSAEFSDVVVSPQANAGCIEH